MTPYSYIYRKRRRNRSEGSHSVSDGDNADNVEHFIHSSTFEIDSETDFPSLSSSVESKVSYLTFY